MFVNIVSAKWLFQLMLWKMKEEHKLRHRTATIDLLKWFLNCWLKDDTKMRMSIPVATNLAITLGYLATRDFSKFVEYLFQVPESTHNLTEVLMISRTFQPVTEEWTSIYYKLTSFCCKNFFNESSISFHCYSILAPNILLIICFEISRNNQNEKQVIGLNRVKMHHFFEAVCCKKGCLNRMKWLWISCFCKITCRCENCWWSDGESLLQMVNCLRHFSRLLNHFIAIPGGRFLQVTHYSRTPLGSWPCRTLPTPCSFHYPLLSILLNCLFPDRS